MLVIEGEAEADGDGEGDLDGDVDAEMLGEVDADAEGLAESEELEADTEAEVAAQRRIKIENKYQQHSSRNNSNNNNKFAHPYDTTAAVASAATTTTKTTTTNAPHQLYRSAVRRQRQHASVDFDAVDDDYEAGSKKQRRHLLMEQLAQQSAEHAENECDLIGKRMAAHFRNMRPDQRLFAERIISEVLVYGRMNRLSLDARFLPNGHENLARADRGAGGQQVAR